MLVPLTSAMYVQGTLESTDNLLVDIGTGYFAEKTLGEATEFCRRKVAMLKERIENTAGVLREKQGQFMQVRGVLQQRVAQEAAKAGQASA